MIKIQIIRQNQNFINNIKIYTKNKDKWNEFAKHLSDISKEINLYHVNCIILLVLLILLIINNKIYYIKTKFNNNAYINNYNNINEIE